MCLTSGWILSLLHWLFGWDVVIVVIVWMSLSGNISKPRRDPLVIPALAGSHKASVGGFFQFHVLVTCFPVVPGLGDRPCALYWPGMVCVGSVSPVYASFSSDALTEWSRG